ncbi:probable Hsp70 nucleotide exchange factor FES1 at N-terminal half [Coccomyxa sp. Obi]|nr:probable Hsp70 nucleotide exchange factor FES1 at N-terminal half [Coccomyxa sp. Obi]
MAQPDWKGLFEWSIQQQDHSTDPSTRRQITEEDRKWFMEAMQSQTEDVTKRLRGIKGALDDKDDSDAQVGEKLKLLDDLVEIVEHIDYAKDLTHIGGLPTLLGLLGSAHAPVRASAAEVVATCVQNHPPVQMHFLEGGVLPRLLQLFQDPDPTCRRKALLALSCLTRHNDEAMDAFRAEGAVDLLLMAARDSSDPRQQRKALQLLREVFRHRPADVRSAARAGLMPAIADGIASEDAGVREAALALLALLVQHPGVVQAVQADERLKELLKMNEQRLNNLDIEDLDAERDQLALTEHILEKLDGGGGPEPDLAAAAPDATVDGANPDTGGQAPDQAPAKPSEEQPVMMLGPP